MLNIEMSGAGYRNANVALREQVGTRRTELDRLRAISPLRRAILPPATVHEIDALSSRIDAAVEQPLTPAVLVTLDDLSKRLSAVLERSNAEVARMRARPRDIPLPAAPRRFHFGTHKFTFSIEDLFREQLEYRTGYEPRHAAELRAARGEVRPYGVGMLARIQQQETVLFFVARGRRSDNPFFPNRKIDAVLRTAVPRGPTFTVEPRGLFRRLFPSSEAIAVEPAFDDAFLTKGDASVAQSLLFDPRIRDHVLAMRDELLLLSAGDGALDLVWRRPFDFATTVVLPAAAVGLVTSLADRLYAA